MRQPYESKWRRSLDDYESPMDSDSFWSRLEPKLPIGERPRTPIFWWWLGSLSVLITAVLIYGLVLLTPQNTEEAAFVIANDKAFTPEHAGWTGHAEVRDQPMHKGEKSDHSSEYSLAPSAQEAHTVFHHYTNTGNTPSTLSGPDESRVMSTSMYTAPVMEGMHAARVEQAGTVQSDDEPNSDAEAIPQVSPAPSPGLDHLATLELPPLDMADPDFPTLQARTLRKGWQLFVDVLSGPGYPSRELMAMEEAYTERIMRRRSYEHPLESWSIGADVRLYAPSGLFLQTGIRRLQISEQFESKHTESRYVWGLGEGFVHHADGNITPWQDSTWVWQTEETHIRHLNRIITWDLPIALGYRHIWGPWSGDIAAGIQTNLRQFTEGRSLNSEDQIISWNETPDYTYHQQIGVSAMVQGRLVWYPRMGYGLFVQPTWYLNPSSRTDASMTGYEVRYHQVLIQTGLSMRFF